MMTVQTIPDGAVAIAEPEPSNLVPPDHFGYEEWGVLVWVGTIEDMQRGRGPFPSKLWNEGWFRKPRHRYLKGVHA